MVRKVICNYTKEYGTSDTFYKAENGKYYKTKEIYEHVRFENKCRFLLLDKLLDIMKYKNAEQFPTTLLKEIKELHINYNYNIILKTFNKCAKNIQYALSNKNFTSEFGKIKYLFAIIKNNINDVQKTEKNKKTYDIIECIDANIINNEISNTRQHKDITEFLEVMDDIK